MERGSSVEYDSEHVGHYLHYNDTQWVGFDDIKSAGKKVNIIIFYYSIARYIFYYFCVDMI